jgi:hypothetical protein
MLDVAIGLLLLFLVTSLVASAIVEAVGGLFHRRQKHLWDTLDLLLGNTSVADEPQIKSIVNELYKQPFITGLVPPNDRVKFEPADPLGTVTADAGANEDGKAKAAAADVLPRRAGVRSAPTQNRPKTRASTPEELKRRYYGPASIEPREFANALLSYIRGDHPAGTDQAAMLSKLPKDLQAKLGVIVEAAGSTFVDLRTEVEEWFDRSMAAASAWYRKQTRWFLFLAGIALAAVLNVDAVHAAVTLYRDQEVRAAVVKIAEQVGEAECSTTPTTTIVAAPATDTEASATANSGNIDIECVRGKVGDSVGIPIGWTNIDRGSGWIARIIGWLFVGFAVTLGAPFWFDLLGRALKVRRK